MATSREEVKRYLHVNINHTVRVRLNDYGLKIHKEYYESFFQNSKFDYRPPQIDSDGYHKFQLWDLMAIYGPHLGLGLEVPFETDIIFRIN